MDLVVYYDFLCPFAYAASVWLRDVLQRQPADLQIKWRFFSLEQVNSKEGPTWKIWEQPLFARSRSLLPFRVAAAARLMGEDIYEKVRWEIFRARHDRGERIHDLEVLTRAIHAAGIDGQELLRRAEDPRAAQMLALDHTEAVEKYGVFGTPTFVVDGRHVAYVKMSPPPTPEEAVEVFREVMAVLVNRPNIHEIKRPEPAGLRSVDRHDQV